MRFRVTLDGAAPGAAHGSDVDAQGYGTVTGQRLYQLVRQPGAIADRTFSIEFRSRRECVCVHVRLIPAGRGAPAPRPGHPLPYRLSKEHTVNTTSPRGPAPQRRTAMLRRIGAIAVAAAAVFGYQRIVNSAEPMRTVPAPTLDETPGASHDETAVLAGGCFWAYRACSST